jgi:hypothetical protein
MHCFGVPNWARPAQRHCGGGSMLVPSGPVAAKPCFPLRVFPLFGGPRRSSTCAAGTRPKQRRSRTSVKKQRFPAFPALFWCAGMGPVGHRRHPWDGARRGEGAETLVLQWFPEHLASLMMGYLFVSENRSPAAGFPPKNILERKTSRI